MLNILRIYLQATAKQIVGGVPATFFSIFCILLCFLPQKTAGQSIGNWTFNNVLTATTPIYNTASTADFSGSVPARSFNGGSEYFGENGWPAGAVNNTMYLAFSLSPNVGYQLDISSIVLRMRRSNTGSPAGSGPTAWALRSSLDGFTSDIASGSITHNYANYTVTPGSSFINIYTTIAFRLYGYNTTLGAGGTSRLVMDNITVNGIGYLLPASIGPFSAAPAAEKVNLSYTIYHAETNNRYFIERSSDAIHFNTVHVQVETGDATEQKYSYTDDLQAIENAAIVYYRIRLQNSTGREMVSPIVAVRRKITGGAIKFRLEKTQLSLYGNFPTTGIYIARVYHFNGQFVAHIPFTVSAGYNVLSLNLPAQLPGCIVQLGNNQGFSLTKFTVRQ